MTTKIAAVIFLGSVMLIRADQLVERAQQALKAQGFYYGEVTGEMNANVTAAIRRYQIRNGLQVSGQLNAETLQSLGIDSSASAHPPDQAKDLPTRRRKRRLLHPFKRSATRRKTNKFIHPIRLCRALHREECLPARHSRLRLLVCNAMWCSRPKSR